VCHIVFARDVSEAGDCYNESGREILLSTICSVTQQGHFYLEKELQAYLKTHFFKYISENEKLHLDLKIEKKMVLPCPDNETYLEDITAGSLASEDARVQIDSNLDSKKFAKEYLSLTSNGSKSIEFRPCDFDEFGFVKEHYASSTATELAYHFYDAGNSYVLQVEMPGFTQEDLDKKKIKIRRNKEEDGKSFTYIIEGTKRMSRPKDGIMDPTIKYGEVLCQTGTLLYVKAADFGEGATKSLSEGILTVKWTKKKLTDDDEI